MEVGKKYAGEFVEDGDLLGAKEVSSAEEPSREAYLGGLSVPDCSVDLEKYTNTLQSQAEIMEGVAIRVMRAMIAAGLNPSFRDMSEYPPSKGKIGISISF